MYRIFKSSKVAIFEIEPVYKNTRIKSEKTKKEWNATYHSNQVH